MRETPNGAGAWPEKPSRADGPERPDGDRAGPGAADGDRAGPGAPDGDRAAPDALPGVLMREPWRFRFFQAVRLLRRMSGQTPLEALVRFRSIPSMAFPASELAALTETPGGDVRYELSLRFFGLLGDRSLLPTHYLERALAAMRDKDRAFVDFLDLFNNRLLTLFYLSWEKARFYVPFERGEPDFRSGALDALAGLRVGPKPAKLPFDIDLVRSHAGLFTRGRGSLEGAQRVLEAAFPGVRIALVQFDPQRLPLEDDSRFRLGRGGRGNQLGRFCPLGRDVWDLQSRVRARVGPLSDDQWQVFDRDGEQARCMQAIWRHLTGDELDLVIERVLSRDGSRCWQLGRKSYRLGRSAWLGGER